MLRTDATCYPLPGAVRRKALTPGFDRLRDVKVLIYPNITKKYTINTTLSYQEGDTMKTSLGRKTLLFPTPVWVIGTYDKEGKPNLMTVAWAGVCCSSPPCVGISLRKATYSYGNILQRKAFTVNIPPEHYLTEADYVGIVSGREADKFSVTKFSAVKGSLVDAPYIEEFPLILECAVIHTFEIGLHTQFIGEIHDVKADPSILGDDGLPVMERILPVLYAPQSRKYYGVGGYLGEAFSLGKTLRNAE